MKFIKLKAIVALCCLSFSALSQDVEITLGTTSNMLNYAGVPIFQWFPDGHISILKEEDSEQYAMYWAGHKSYRTLGNYQYPEFQLTLSPTDKILGDKTDVDAWDNGGSWLMSVFRVEGDTLLGFYHAEDHYYGTDNPGNIAWKSLARVISYDNGSTWEQPEQIITSNRPKPDTPEWGGSGDNAVIWDEVNERWLCYHQEEFIMVAMSEDRLGRPGTWYKYYEGSFSQPGIEGMASRVNGLTINGGNPSVHFNHYLNKYVMVYHGWNRSTYLSTSPDGINWEIPTNILAPSGQNRIWYPTIIGDTDLFAGKVARIYYADMSTSSRNFVSRAIIFDETKTYKPINWSYEKIGSFSMNGSFDSLSTEAYRILSFEGELAGDVAYGYHYQEIDDDFESSFLLSIDSDMAGPVGWAIRAGSGDSDEEVVLAFDGSQILLNGAQLVDGLSATSVYMSIKIINEVLTISYQDEDDNWVDIHSDSWVNSSSLLGFFTIGSPDQPVIGYLSNFSIEPYVALGTDEIMEGQLTVYPNPISDSINITGAERVVRVILIGLDGQVLQDVNDIQLLSFENLLQGVYVLKILQADGQMKYQKVIKN